MRSRVLVAVLVAATLAACTATTLPPSSTSGPTRTTVATVALSRVQAFVTLARRGIGMPFQATYKQLWAPPRVGNGRPRHYEVWSEPQPPRHQERFVYQAPFKSGTLRFIGTGKVYYECLKKTAVNRWRCVGPFTPGGNGQIAQTQSFSFPLSAFLYGQVEPGVPATALSHETVMGRRAWCLTVGRLPQGGEKICLARTGQVVLWASRGSHYFLQLRLAALRLYPAKAPFALPVTPSPWTPGGAFPNLCGGRFCPSPDF